MQRLSAALGQQLAAGTAHAAVLRFGSGGVAACRSAGDDAEQRSAIDADRKSGPSFRPGQELGAQFHAGHAQFPKKTRFCEYSGHAPMLHQRRRGRSPLKFRRLSFAPHGPPSGSGLQEPRQKGVGMLFRQQHAGGQPPGKGQGSDRLAAIRKCAPVVKRKLDFRRPPRGPDRAAIRRTDGNVPPPEEAPPA
jgi:hypothetical protein